MRLRLLALLLAAIRSRRATTRLVVCTVCRGSERSDPAEPRAGARLFERLLVQRDRASAVRVEERRCLWACASGCVVWIAGAGKPSYLLGSLDADETTASDLLSYAELYAGAEDGEVPYPAWPPTINGRFLARMPAQVDS